LIFINCVTNVHAKQFQDTLYGVSSTLNVTQTNSGTEIIT